MTVGMLFLLWILLGVVFVLAGGTLAAHRGKDIFEGLMFGVVAFFAVVAGFYLAHAIAAAWGVPL